MNSLTIIGNLTSTRYHEALHIADDILCASVTFINSSTNATTNNPTLTNFTIQDSRTRIRHKAKTPLSLRIIPLIEQSFIQFVKNYETQKQLQHRHPLTEPLIIHSIDGYIGCVDELVTWASKYNFKDIRKQLSKAHRVDIESELQQAAKEALRNYMLTSENTFAYFDVTVPTRIIDVIENAKNGKVNNNDNINEAQTTEKRKFRLIFELFSKQLPKACKNFSKLCEGINFAELKTNRDTFQDDNPRITLPKSRIVPNHLSYQNTNFHRISPSFIQGGDVVGNSGNDGESIYGTSFDDENFSISHNTRGILSYANSGRHSNSSQFFICFQPLPTFDKKYVAFGQLVYGEQWLTLMDSIGKYSSFLSPFSMGECNDSYDIRELVCLNESPKFAINIEKCGNMTTTMIKEQVLEDNYCMSSFSSFYDDRLNTSSSTSGDSRPLSTETGASKKATVVVIGIGRIGKSALVNHWIGEPSTTTLPTVGLEIHRRATDSTLTMTFFGLGGNDNLRGYWNNYYESAHVIVIVVPSNLKAFEDDNYWNTLQYELDDEILLHPYVKNKPFLIMCNSFNESNAPPISSQDIANRLQLEIHPNVRYFDCCLRLTEEHEVSNEGAMNGLHYIIQSILDNWEVLDTRVRKDCEISKQLRKQEMQKLKEKIIQNENNIQAKETEECKEEVVNGENPICT